jgi:prophage antirepressor-like protein
MSAIIPFQFEAHAVRVQVDGAGLPWFNASDICSILEFGNSRQALESHVDADDVQKLEPSTTLAAPSAPTTSTSRASTP